MLWRKSFGCESIRRCVRPQKSKMCRGTGMSARSSTLPPLIAAERLTGWIHTQKIKCEASSQLSIASSRMKIGWYLIELFQFWRRDLPTWLIFQHPQRNSRRCRPFILTPAASCACYSAIHHQRSCRCADVAYQSVCRARNSRHRRHFCGRKNASVSTEYRANRIRRVRTV